jgi:GT2 family glycosyltransferase
MENNLSKGKILIFGILEWYERFQRPQEIALALSNLGWKVAYVSPNLQENNFQGYSITKEINLNLSLVRISVPGTAPNPYVGIPSKNQEISFSLNLNKFCRDNDFDGAIYVMQIPFWWYFLRNESNFVMYDCMDYHKGFDILDSNAHDIEFEAINNIDKLVVSSSFLGELYKNNHPVLIRNGCDPSKFHIKSNTPKQGMFNIGYFGVVDKWFDVVLIKKLAQEIPDVIIHLIGNVSDEILKEISLNKNFKLHGEVPHSDLDALSDMFDLAIIPFLITDLTKATDPVKIYEYAAKGLFTISTNLPELQEVPDYVVQRANSHSHFIDSIKKYIANPDLHKDLRENRRTWAIENTWKKRASIFEKIIVERSKLHLIAIICYNNSQSLINLIKSIKNYCSSNLSILLIDNSDDTIESNIINEFISNDLTINRIRPGRNIGFSAACNLALYYAMEQEFEYVTLLNDDVLFEMDYISRVEAHFNSNLNLRLIGPLTNSTGNEARVDYLKNDIKDKKYFLNTLLGLRRGQVLLVERLAFFAVTLRRETIVDIGLLDESYGQGYFEDDDYCIRVTSKNHDIAIALDCYITHAHSMSFDKLGEKKRLDLLNRNKKIFESKHGVWTPHRYKKDHLTIHSVTKHLF